jgi:hypothetical protein
MIGTLMPLFAVLTALSVPATRPGEVFPQAFRNDLFEVLRFGGSAYVCEVGNVEPLKLMRSSSVETGSVELRISQTIIGPSHVSLRVPYTFRTSHHGSPWMDDVWGGDPRRFQGRTVLCLVIAPQLDPLTSVVPGCDASVACVFAVSGATDADVYAIRDAAKLHRIVDPDALTQALKSAVLDPRDRLRIYALEATARRLLPVDVASAAAIITARIAHDRQIPYASGEVEHLVKNVQSVALSDDLTMPSRREIAKSVCEWIALGSPDFSQRSIDYLSAIVLQKGISSSDVQLTPATRSALERKLRWLATHEDDTPTLVSASKRILAWLAADESNRSD